MVKVSGDVAINAGSGRYAATQPIGRQMIGYVRFRWVGSARDDGNWGQSRPADLRSKLRHSPSKADRALHPCGAAFRSIALFERSLRRIDLGKR